MSYGTLHSSNDQHNEANVSNNNNVDEERAELLNRSSKEASSKWMTRLHDHLTVNVSRKHGDVPLLLCYFITGLLDTSSIMTWGTFVSMQTGNTVYLGRGIVAPYEDNHWIRALIALSSFSLGSFIFARLHRAFSPRKRWVLLGSYIIQISLIAGAACIVTFGPQAPKKGPLTAWVVVPISMIALQSAGQAIMSRVLKYGSLTSVVLTSIYCDLFSDEHLFAGLRTNPERNRRLAAPILLLGGAMVAGVFERSPLGFAGALWTAVGVKAIIIVSWWFWRADEDDESLRHAQ